MTFFERTPIGSIINRFSSDIGCLDDIIRYNIYFIFSYGIYNILMILTVAIINPYVFIPLIILIYFLIRKLKFV